MKCKSVLIRLDEMRTGELDPQEKHEIHEHVGTCRSCDATREAVEQLASSFDAPTGGDAAERRARMKVALRRQCLDGISSIEIDGRRYFVAFTDRGISMVEPDLEEELFRKRYRDRFRRELEARDLPEAFRTRLVNAVRGEGCSGDAVDIHALPEFEQRVLTRLLDIPRGEVRTYAWLAREAGNPAAVRAVGNALARNPVAPILPCHRIIPTAGGVGNYAYGTAAKRRILAAEGVPVERIDELASRRVRYVGNPESGTYCFPTCSNATQDDRVDLRDEADAVRHGLRPCGRCRPLAPAA